MAKNLEMSYLLDFYGNALTEKQQEMMIQYYNDDLSLSEIGENFGITRQGVRDAIKHGESSLLELEEKVGFAGRYRHVQEKLLEMEQIIRDARFENSGRYSAYNSADFDRTLKKLLDIVHSIEGSED